MPSDYIPNADNDFHSWQANFMTYANGHLGGLGIVAADMAPITAAQTTWNGVYSANSAAQAAAQSAVQNKDAARGSFEALLRALVVRLQASPARERINSGVPTPWKPCCRFVRHSGSLTAERTGNG